MTGNINKWPSVPSSSGTTAQGSGQTGERAEGAKNLWEEGYHRRRLNAIHTDLNQEDLVNRTLKELNTTKTKIRVGHWNVRTMYETGKLAQVTSEMRRFKLHVLGVSESRWTGSGKLKSTSGETVLYSGREDDLHYEGVAIILKKGLEQSVLEWKPVNSRLMSVRLKGRHVNITIIQCYAPTNDSDENDKEEFYNLLQTETEKTPRHDILVVMGDLNAKVGNDSTDYERVMGKHGVGTKNNNGERLLDFCDLNNLVIGGTLFTHHDIHKLTWNSPNGRDRNQIDHLMINGMWRRSLLDVKVKRSADVGSDHHLVIALVKTKLKKTNQKPNMQTRFDTQKLKDNTVKTAFILDLKNRFQALQELSNEDTNIEVAWEKVTTLYNKSSRKELGNRQKKASKDWIQQETLEAIEERRDIKKRLLQTKSLRLKERQEEMYRKANYRVKELARRDKREAMEKLAAEAEEAAGKREQGKLFKITRQICGKFKGSVGGPIKDKRGKLLTTEKEQEERWTEHFQEVLNRPSPNITAEIPECDIDLCINTDQPTKTEIIAAIKNLKNGKSPGQDNLDAELFKADPELSADILQPLFSAIWEEEAIPEEWTKGIIIKIPKKGALNDCNNWRGITLLSVPSKILAKIIIKRISESIDVKLREEQAGFRKERGCSDQIFALRNIIEQCSEWQRQLYVNFVDFEKAFDSIHRDSLWNILRHYGIPTKVVNLIRSFYKNFRCSVGHNDTFFEVKTGVRQGCVMSALLFNVVIDWVMTKTTEDSPRGIRWGLFSTLDDLDFADDLALLSHTHQHIQEKTDRLCLFGQQVGLKISAKKTETMTLNVNGPAAVKVNGTDLKQVDKFTYLGSIIRPEGGTKEDISNRLSKARSVFRDMSNVWRSSQYNTSTKLKLYQSCVISVLLYGSECWRMTATELNRLRSFHTTCLRRILRIFWPEKISNEDLLRRCKQEDMGTIISRRRWRWIGHVLRRKPDSTVRTALHWTPEGKRKRGRPRETWRRTVETEMKVMKHSWDSLTRMAQDRQRWKDFVAALHTTGCKGK